MYFIKFNQADFKLMFSHLDALIKLKCVKPVVGTRYKLEEAAKAQYDIINNTGTTGRLTLLVD